MINANLKRVFCADLCDDLPDQFVDLLSQLEKLDQETNDPTIADPKGESDED